MSVRWENKFHEECWEEDDHQAGRGHLPSRCVQIFHPHLLMTDSHCTPVLH